MRRCSKCRESKSAEEFYSARGWCKSCHREYNRINSKKRSEATKRWLEKNRSEAGSDSSTCNRCGWTKSLEEFYFRNDRGYRRQCKECFDKHLSAITEKKCSACKEVRPISEFIFDSLRQKYRPRCGTCQAVDRKEVYLRDKGAVREMNKRARYRSYGLSDEDILSLDSRDKCEACGDTENLVVDHCHERLVFRGVLCHRCNITLGYAKDSIDRLSSLAEYLKRSI